MLFLRYSNNLRNSYCALSGFQKLIVIKYQHELPKHMPVHILCCKQYSSHSWKRCFLISLPAIMKAIDCIWDIRVWIEPNFPTANLHQINTYRKLYPVLSYTEVEYKNVCSHIQVLYNIYESFWVSYIPIAFSCINKDYCWYNKIMCIAK